ncbi:MAG: nicotinate-nucleotide--dimethylbenzimidazole phosphoribosyltransferase [Sulfurifustis sp.]
MPIAGWLERSIARPDDAARRAAEERQQKLTKPPGALGRLETIAIRLAALQRTEQPAVECVHIAVFVGDHGVAAEDVSAFPQAVTGEMLRNFARGGAAINAIARELHATIDVIDLGTINDPGPLDGVTRRRLGASTANFTCAPAMTSEQLDAAFAAGASIAEHAKRGGAQLLIGGEMGIGNTTSAAALSAALLDLPPERVVGPGTGVDALGIARKIAVVNRALAHHRHHLASPLETLRRLGGFEIAALTGCYLACAQEALPVLVDGFIATSAALAAVRLRPEVADWLFFGHASAEPGHRALLAALNADPLLDLGMRLGEGSGAATAVPLLRIACALHNGMATFAQAGVSGKTA